GSSRGLSQFAGRRLFLGLLESPSAAAVAVGGPGGRFFVVAEGVVVVGDLGGGGRWQEHREGRKDGERAEDSNVHGGSPCLGVLSLPPRRHVRKNCVEAQTRQSEREDGR